MEPNQLLELFLGTQQDKRRVVAERYAKSLTSEFFVTADFLLKKVSLAASQCSHICFFPLGLHELPHFLIQCLLIHSVFD